MLSFDAYQERFRRQVHFAPLGKEGQDKLKQSRVAIVGVGALGTIIAERLVRAGVGEIRLIDRDWVELDNLPRQTLFTESDVAAREPKATAAAAHLARIDSSTLLEAHVSDVSYRNIDNLLQDIDLVMDGTDNFETRYLLNDYCHSQKMPWVHGGCLGAAGQVMAIRPGQTPCFRCLVPIAPHAGDQATCDTAGVLGPAVTIIGAWQCIEAIKLLTRPDSVGNGSLIAIDIWNGMLRKIDLKELLAEHGCPSCRGDWPFLDGRAGTDTAILCGRNAVQVYPSVQQKIDLVQLAERWRGVTEVESTLYWLRSEMDGLQITVFSDGRAVIRGTTDPAVARAVYARRIGC